MDKKYLQINAEYPDNFQQALNRGCVFVDIEKNILIGASDFRKDGCAIGY